MLNELYYIDYYILVFIYVRLVAVSYTHLDVYKRQEKGCMQRVHGTLLQACPARTNATGNAFFRTENVVPVSYTHLDVYKRQPLPTTSNWH